MIRQVINFSGRVQGVGFRATTKATARGYEVTGTVRNLPDDSVEVVVEGERKEIEAFRSDLASRMAGFIRDSTTREAEYTGEFDSFRILH